MTHPLACFLRSRKELFLSCKGPISKWVFVCGNESTDLDSTASPLAFAYMYDHWNGRPLVPFVNSENQKILEMRGEIGHVLGKYGLATLDLLFFEHVFGRLSKESSSSLSVFLIDHNEVTLKWRLAFPKLDCNVMGIIDHHKDGGCHLAASPRKIAICGSSASLLLSHLLEDPSVSREKVENIGALLLDTIIFDTVNLSWRETDLDIEMVRHLKRLEDSTSLDQVRSTTAGLLAELDSALIDEANFDTFDLLFKDYKFYSHQGGGDNRTINYGISTVHVSFDHLTEKGAKLDVFLKEVARFMQAESITHFLLTIAIRIPTGGHYQQLGIFCLDAPEDLLGLHQALRSCDLTAISVGKCYGIYDQANLDISRKQLHPMMRDYFTTEEKNRTKTSRL